MPVVEYRSVIYQLSEISKMRICWKSLWCEKETLCLSLVVPAHFRKSACAWDQVNNRPGRCVIRVSSVYPLPKKLLNWKTFNKYNNKRSWSMRILELVRELSNVHEDPEFLTYLTFHAMIPNGLTCSKFDSSVAKDLYSALAQLCTKSETRGGTCPSGS